LLVDDGPKEGHWERLFCFFGSFAIEGFFFKTKNNGQSLFIE
jgi:hypothetical protein